MSHFVYAWELGGGYGHTANFLPIALKLRAQGHRVTFILKDLTHAETLLGPHGFTFLQAPIWLGRLDALTHPVNYAELLFKVGYLSRSCIAGMVEAWHVLFELLQPDLILCDHAPTALLATRGMATPKALIGNGFFCPPHGFPMPSFRPGTHIPQSRLIESERIALKVVNSVLRDKNLPEMHQLSEMLHADETFLTTYPDLDHYPDRGNAVYWGPVSNMEEGASIVWPSGTGKKLFVYLKPTEKHFDDFLRALAILPVRALIHAPGISPQLVTKYSASHIRFYQQPVKMAQVARECDAAVCNGTGTISTMLFAGRPVLMYPIHQEQYIPASRVTQMGAGNMVARDQVNINHGALLSALLNEPVYAKQAQVFAAKHAHYSQASVVDRIVNRCVELAALGRPCDVTA